MSEHNRALEAISRHLEAIDSRLADHHRHIVAILQNQEKIMSAISQYADAAKASFATMKTGLDTLATKIQALDDLITQLQNNPGPISAADQALLDEAQGISSGLAAQVTALAATPVPPPPPPTA